MALDPGFITLAEESEGADTCGSEKLDCEDRVDFADELIANIDRGFGNGTSELCWNQRWPALLAFNSKTY